MSIAVTVACQAEVIVGILSRRQPSAPAPFFKRVAGGRFPRHEQAILATYFQGLPRRQAQLLAHLAWQRQLAIFRHNRSHVSKVTPLAGLTSLYRLGEISIESRKNWERGIGVPPICQMPRIIEFRGFDPEPQPETSAERLTYARRRLGLAQEDLAKILDVDPGTILRWEKGDCVPAAKKLARVRGLRPANNGLTPR